MQHALIASVQHGRVASKPYGGHKDGIYAPTLGVGAPPDNVSISLSSYNH